MAPPSSSDQIVQSSSMFTPSYAQLPEALDDLLPDVRFDELNALSGEHAADHPTDKSEKKRRTNYKKPENAAKLNAAVNALLLSKQDPSGQKDIRSVSKLYDIPYNTLRDNYLKMTTGELRVSKRPKRRKEDDEDFSDLDSAIEQFHKHFDPLKPNASSSTDGLMIPPQSLAADSSYCDGHSSSDLDSNIVDYSFQSYSF